MAIASAINHGLGSIKAAKTHEPDTIVPIHAATL
jgi:hypothetical protein